MFINVALGQSIKLDNNDEVLTLCEISKGQFGSGIKLRRARSSQLPNETLTLRKGNIITIIYQQDIEFSVNFQVSDISLHEGSVLFEVTHDLNTADYSSSVKVFMEYDLI